MRDKYIQTAESVTEGHPDKLCDTIADTVLDACLRSDPAARVACEVLDTAGKILVAGEITAAELPDIPALICRTVREAGYGGTLTARVLADALCATARRRGTLRLLSEAEDVLRELADDPHMRKLWDTYRARYSYASELTWDIVLSSVRQLCIAAGLAVELPEVTLTAPSRTAASAVLRRREKER